MKSTQSVKVHIISLFLVSAVLLIPGLLSASEVNGHLQGMSPLWYWLGAILPVLCGLISFSGGMLVYRKKAVTPLSKCALWVGLFCLYFLAIIVGDLFQQTASSYLPASFAVLFASRFLIPLIAAWLVGVKPALAFAVLPAAIQLANIAYHQSSVCYIILSAVGCLLSVSIFTAEPFHLAFGGRMHPAFMVLCALSDATLVQMIFNVFAVRMADKTVAIGIIQFIPFVIVSVLLRVISKRKENAEQD